MKKNCTTPTRNFKFLTVTIVLLITNLFLLKDAAGQGTMGRWEMCGLTGTTGSVNATGVVNANVTFSALSRGAGLTGASVANGYSSTGWSTATNLDITQNDYYEFTITPAAGYKMSITALKIRDLLSSTGSSFDVYLRYSGDAYASNLSTWTPANTSANNRTINLSAVTALQNRTTPVTFRVYGSDANSATTTTYRFDCQGTAAGNFRGVDVDGTVAQIAYASQLVGMNFGSSTWCAGETRNVQVQIKNVGSAAWTDGSGNDFNIGVKWNTSGSNWTDYHIRVDAQNLASGATGTYTLPLTASNATVGPVYGSPLAAGSNNLTFDVVYESVSWFGNNGGVVGPGNTAFTSSAITISARPVISAMTAAACSGNAFTVTPVNGTNGTVPAGTTYSWPDPVVTGGLTGGAASSGSPASIGGTLTNPTTTAQTAIYTVTPVTGSCTGSSFTVTVTINPKSSVTAMTAATCGGTGFSVTPVNGTDGTVISGTTYSWPAPVVTGGLTGGAAGSAASAISGTLNNPSTTAQTATYTVTPTTAGCAGATFTVTVTVNPKAAISAVTTTVCEGASFSVTPVHGTNGVVPSGTTYSWTAPSVTGGMTGGAAGSGANISGTLSNTTNAPHTATYTVTPVSGTCTGANFTVTVTVNPVPAINDIPATACSGTGFTVTPANGVNGFVPTNATYTWPAPSVTGGLTGGAASSGSPANISGTLTNPTAAAQTATYTVTPASGSCAGSSFTVTVTVNPRPTLSSPLSPAAVCSGTLFTYTASSNVAGTVFTWTRAAVAGISNAAVSSPQSTDPSETLNNTTNATVNVVYAYTLNANGCSNTQNVTVPVSPKPAINPMTGTVCSATAFTATPANGTNGIVPAGTTYAWSAPVVTGGLTGGAASSGTPTNISGTLTNPNNTAQTAVYTITPTSGSCTGNTFTLTETVNPRPAITAMTATTCSAVAFSAVPANATNGTVPAGTTYSWPAPSVTGGLTGGASGSAASTISGTLTNPTNTAHTATYTVTPSFAGCAGSSFTVTVTVNPKATITAITTAVCSNQEFTVAPVNATNGVVPAGTTYSWPAPSVTGGLTGGAAESGQPNITGTLTNTTTAAQTATYTVTAVSGSCTGNSFTVTVTVNPLPVTVDAVVCQNSSGNLAVSSSCIPGAAIASGPRFAASGATGGSGTAWSNPGNIVSDNNSNATVAGSTSGNVVSQTLTATGYGFSIPANASIVGIQCTIGRYRSGGISGEAQDNSLRLLKAGVAVGADKAATSTNWPASEAAVTYGAANDLWTTTWSAGEINASNFGVAFVADISQGFISARTAQVDYITLTVSYTLPGIVNWFTVSSNGTSFGSGSSFNPVGVLNSGLPNTNTPGTTTFYAECSTFPGCRTAADFTITAASTSAVLSGDAQICDGSSTNLQVAIDGGVAPYSVVYTDGSNNFTVNNYNSNDNIAVSPSVPTSYSLVSVTSTGGCVGTGNTGTAAITFKVDPAITSATFGSSPLCSGETTTLTANGVAGTNATVTWWTGTGGSGTQVGAGSTSNPVGAGTYYAYVTGDCITTAETSVTVGSAGNTFTGNGNWTDNARWSCGVPPTTGDEVIIASGANAILNTNFTVAGSLSLTATSSLVVNPANTLAIGSTGTADFAGQAVTFRSDNSGTSSLGQVAGSLTGATNVTVERYIPNNGFRSWRLLSVPTYGSGQTIRQAWQEGNANPLPMQNNLPNFGTQITGAFVLQSAAAAAGFDSTSITAGLLTWNGSAWSNVTTTNTAIANSKAYFLYTRGERSKGVTGATDNSSATTLRTNGTVYTGDQENNINPNNFALVPNVYPSAIDFTGLTLTGGVSNLFYVWDSKKLNGSSLGVYQTFSGTNGFNCMISGGSYVLSQPNTIIESGQAFFVKTNNTAGSVILKESAKISNTNGNLGFRPSTPASALVKIDTRLYSTATNNMMDANAVVFDAAYSDAIDGDDAPKFANSTENLGIQKGTAILAIEGRQPVNGSDVIQFRMWNMQRQAYRFEVVAGNMSAQGVSAVLEDAYLQTSTALDLSGTTTVSFTVDANAGSSAANRFRIVFRPLAPVPVNFVSITGLRTNAGVKVDWKSASERGIKEYVVERSFDGNNFTAVGAKTAASNNAIEISYSFMDVKAPSTILMYRIKSQGINNEIRYSPIAKINAGDFKTGFAISPNPVENGMMNLQFRNQQAGKYTVRIVSNSGKTVLLKTVSHAGGNNNQAVTLPAALAGGNYNVEIISPDNLITVQALLVNKK